MRKKKVKRILAVGLISIAFSGTIFFYKEIGIRINDYSKGIEKIWSTYQENQKLKKMMNSYPLEIKLIQLESENYNLDRANKGKQKLSDIYSYSTSRMINWDSTSYIKLDLGEQDGVKKGASVLSIDGYLIGTIVDLNKYTSTFQLINSKEFLMNKAITVKSKGKKSFGIIEEYNSEQDTFIVGKISVDDEMKVNDEIVTSGGEVSNFPSGLKIGFVSEIGVGDMGLTNQAIIKTKKFDVNKEVYVFIVNVGS